MKNILSRLAQEPVIQLVMFTDHTILNEPVEDWPICNSLIAFYSHGFPLEKAIEYVKLRNPLVLNDLESQYALMDRYVHVCVCGVFLERKRDRVGKTLGAAEWLLI